MIRAEAIHGKLTVDSVAAAAGLNRRTLQLRFRNRLGRTVLQEITRVRVEHARLLLASTGLSVLDVALQCGYAGGEVFTRAFRRVAGMTPLRYRHSRKPSLPYGSDNIDARTTR